MPQMELLAFDDRERLQQSSGLHALITGVSFYPNTTILPTLSSPCVSALKVFRWLVEHRGQLSSPLATCRLLLSPSLYERRVRPELRDPQVNLGASPCDFHDFIEAVRNWREDVNQHNGSTAFFYFAGHGYELDYNSGILAMA